MALEEEFGSRTQLVEAIKLVTEAREEELAGLDQTVKLQEEYNKLVMNARASIDPVERQLQKHAEEVANLNRIYDEGAITLDQFNEGMGALVQSNVHALQSISGVGREFDTAKEAQERFVEITNQLLGQQDPIVRLSNTWAMVKEEIEAAGKIAGRTRAEIDALLAIADDLHQGQINDLEEVEDQFVDVADEMQKGVFRSPSIELTALLLKCGVRH